MTYTRKLKSKRAIATDITRQVKLEVWARDKGRCVYCGSTYNVMPNAHVVPRSKGGMGIPTNIVTLCTSLTENRCHHFYDNGTKEQREKIDTKIVAYMKYHYGDDWCKEDQVYKKYGDK